MPAHPTLRGRLAFAFLLALSVFTLLATSPAMAANPYEIHDGGEGDPGDGVLKPAKPTYRATASGTMTTSYTTGTTLFRLPVVVLIDARGLPQIYYVAPSASWGYAVASWYPTGRWHDAR